MGKSGRNGETGAMTTIEFKDYSAECKEEIESRVLKALTMCGMVIERAKQHHMGTRWEEANSRNL